MKGVKLLPRVGSLVEWKLPQAGQLREKNSEDE
jgi:hypothetical protein